MPAARPEILLLGPVAAVGDGEPLALGGARQRRLLALLALERGRVISFDRLSDELWSGSPPPGSPTTLRSYVSRLRASLGSAAIGARGGGYVLEAESVDVDVARAEALAAEGRTAFERGAAGLAATRLASALELWRGRTLDDVRDDGSLAVAGARLDELRLTLLEQRLEADLQLGRHAEVVAEASSRSSPPSLCASGSGTTSCSPSIAPDGRPTRSRSIAARPRPCVRSSGSTRAQSFVTSSVRCSGTRYRQRPLRSSDTTFRHR